MIELLESFAETVKDHIRSSHPHAKINHHFNAIGHLRIDVLFIPRHEYLILAFIDSRRAIYVLMLRKPDVPDSLLGSSRQFDLNDPGSIAGALDFIMAQLTPPSK